MNNEQIASILNKVIKQQFPKIDMEIFISTEPDMTHMYIISNKRKEIYNVFFSLSPDDYNKYVSQGIDKPIWDKIKELIIDFIKMLGITDKVRFYF